MVKCSYCDREAVYIHKSGGKAYCARHFLWYFDRKVRRTIRKYRMFGEEEHIVVAVSGGKDSLALLHYLTKLSGKVPGWRVSALLIDEGIRGYREVTIEDFLRVARDLGVDYRIARFKDYFGYALDEIIRIGRERKLPYLPCTYCGVLRRYLLNKVAREMGGTVLATAHNLDDIVQTYLMNVIQNNWKGIVKLVPAAHERPHPKFIRRVKPFYEVLEKETTLYAILNNLYPKFVECPYAVESMRWSIRRFINGLEERRPGVKYSLLNSLKTALSKCDTNSLYGGVMRTCRICGEPSSHEICRACRLRIELGILEFKESSR